MGCIDGHVVANKGEAFAGFLDLLDGGVFLVVQVQPTNNQSQDFYFVAIFKEKESRF